LLGAVGKMILGVDGPDGTNVGLVASGAGGAFLEVDVQNAVAEHADRIGIRSMAVLNDPLPASSSETSALVSGLNS